MDPTRPARSTVIPAMRYRDAPAAIEWLCRVLGFEKHWSCPAPATPSPMRSSRSAAAC